MHWGSEAVPFRRTDFRERPPAGNAPLPVTAGPEIPETRTLIIPPRPDLLPRLLLFRCPLAPVGGDWHIAARSRDETERVLGFLKLNRVHGIIRRRRPVAR